MSDMQSFSVLSILQVCPSSEDSFSRRVASRVPNHAPNHSDTLTPWWEMVVSERIAPAYDTVGILNDKLSMLVLSNLSGTLNGFRLCAVDAGCAIRAR